MLSLFSSTIPIDPPAPPIDWSWSSEAFRQKHPEPDYFKGPFVSLFELGPLTCHGYAYSTSQLSSVYLRSIPQEIRTDIPLFNQASDILLQKLGAPTISEMSSFCLWPDHERLYWNYDDTEILLFIDDVFWNSMEVMTIQIQKTDRSRVYSGWNPHKK